MLYLITFLAGIPSAFLLEPVLSNPNYIVGGGADTQVLFGNFLDVVNALACIGTAVTLYPLIRWQHEGFALGFVTTRMVEAAVILIGTVSCLRSSPCGRKAPLEPMRPRWWWSGGRSWQSATGPSSWDRA